MSATARHNKGIFLRGDVIPSLIFKEFIYLVGFSTPVCIHPFI
jgi:hypothetical protein